MRRFAERLSGVIESAFLVGETGPELHALFQELGRPSKVYGTLEEATLAAARDVAQRTVVLLSPGFSSFDMFRGYAERGLVFERAAHGLAQKSR
jgi:UDP-N-acetylmuramoylalanine--D-glutamate ligase